MADTLETAVITSIDLEMQAIEAAPDCHDTINNLGRTASSLSNSLNNELRDLVNMVNDPEQLTSASFTHAFNSMSQRIITTREQVDECLQFYQNKRDSLLEKYDRMFIPAASHCGIDAYRNMQRAKSHLQIKFSCLQELIAINRDGTHKIRMVIDAFKNNL